MTDQPTLYRIGLPEPPPYTQRMVVSPEQFEDGTYQPVGTLVPVEPCVHGNYARHIIAALGERQYGQIEYSWCDGVGEGTE